MTGPCICTCFLVVQFLTMALIGQTEYKFFFISANQQTLTIKSQQSIRVLGELDVDIGPPLLLIIDDRSLHLHGVSSRSGELESRVVANDALLWYLYLVFQDETECLLGGVAGAHAQAQVQLAVALIVDNIGWRNKIEK